MDHIRVEKTTVILVSSYIHEGLPITYNKIHPLIESKYSFYGSQAEFSYRK